MRKLDITVESEVSRLIVVEFDSLLAIDTNAFREKLNAALSSRSEALKVIENNEYDSKKSKSETPKVIEKKEDGDKKNKSDLGEESTRVLSQAALSVQAKLNLGEFDEKISLSKFKSDVIEKFNDFFNFYYLVFDALVNKGHYLAAQAVGCGINSEIYKLKAKLKIKGITKEDHRYTALEAHQQLEKSKLDKLDDFLKKYSEFTQNKLGRRETTDDLGKKRLKTFKASYPVPPVILPVSRLCSLIMRISGDIPTADTEKKLKNIEKDVSKDLAEIDSCQKMALIGKTIQEYPETPHPVIFSQFLYDDLRKLAISEDDNVYLTILGIVDYVKNNPKLPAEQGYYLISIASRLLEPKPLGKTQPPTADFSPIQCEMIAISKNYLSLNKPKSPVSDKTINAVNSILKKHVHFAQPKPTAEYSITRKDTKPVPPSVTAPVSISTPKPLLIKETLKGLQAKLQSIKNEKSANHTHRLNRLIEKRLECKIEEADKFLGIMRYAVLQDQSLPKESKLQILKEIDASREQCKKCETVIAPSPLTSRSSSPSFFTPETPPSGSSPPISATPPSSPSLS